MNRASRRHRDRTRAMIATGLAVLVLASLALSFGFSRWTEQTKTFTVNRVLDQATSHCGSDGHCKTGHRYLVFTNHGTYKDTDAFWFLKFNSSDIIGQLQDGHTYRCDTTGFRLPIGSSYRNLIHCTEAS